MAKLYRISLPAIKTIAAKTLSVLIALSIVFNGLNINPPISVAAKSNPASGPKMDPKSMNFGSGWNNIQPDKPAIPLLQQLASNQSAPQTFPVHIDLEIEPAIYIPGVPIQLTWTIQNFDHLDLASNP